MSALTLSVGFMGMALSFAYRIPQMIKLYRTKGYKDISTWMIHLQNLSYVFYVTYAIMINDVVNLTSSIVSLTQNFIVLFMIWLYASRQETTSHPIENLPN